MRKKRSILNNGRTNYGMKKVKHSPHLLKPEELDKMAKMQEEFIKEKGVTQCKPGDGMFSGLNNPNCKQQM